jgi:hypothetical protein
MAEWLARPSGRLLRVVTVDAELVIWPVRTEPVRCELGCGRARHGSGRTCGEPECVEALWAAQSA